MLSSFAESTKTNEQKKVSSSTQWWTRCTQPRSARFPTRKERETKSELFEAEKSLPADKKLEQPTCESDVAEETMLAMMKLAKEIDEPHDISEQRKLGTRRDELRPVQGEEENTEELVMTFHTEMCEKSEVTSVEEGHDVERVIVTQSDETAGILKQVKPITRKL